MEEKQKVWQGVVLSIPNRHYERCEAQIEEAKKEDKHERG